MMVWTRRRYFVGHRHTGKYELFSEYYEPSYATHSKRYSFVFGPYRTRKRAKQVMGYQS